ncbi:oligoribonuclease, mitochondrial-like [Callospermophilus lateralis]|uniref:oligoribonuclease, mitochondrial-like n=1 Tax=Callospermophilus lateralis TaxID=76772 RepID=UPI0040543427
MLGGSVGSRLLRGVGGSRRQFGSRGVRGGGAAMAAGESMAQRMVWVDLEMTGLDIEKDQIIEMACLITDSDLNILAEGPNLIIKQPDELLDSISDWCKEHHGKSGLTKAVKESTITLQQAEYEFLSFVRQQTPPGLCPLAGCNHIEMQKQQLREQQLKRQQQDATTQPHIKGETLRSFALLNHCSSMLLCIFVPFHSQKVLQSEQPVDTTFFLEEAASLLRNVWTRRSLENALNESKTPGLQEDS